jgi:hypothetical protein
MPVFLPLHLMQEHAEMPMSCAVKFGVSASAQTRQSFVLTAAIQAHKPMSHPRPELCVTLSRAFLVIACGVLLITCFVSRS